MTGALDLELFTKLSGKKLNATDLAELCSIKIRQPEDIFDFLVAMKLLDRDENNLYSNTYTSETFLNRNDMSKYYGTTIAFHVKSDRWGKFSETITQPALQVSAKVDKDFY